MQANRKKETVARIPSQCSLLLSETASNSFPRQPRIHGSSEDKQIETMLYPDRHKKAKKNLKHRFEILKTLGQGTYGKVKLAVEKETNVKYAIKSIRRKHRSEQDMNRVWREIEIMSSLKHPHIISIYEVFENRDKLIMVMEHASGGEMYDYINDKLGLYEDEARRFFRQIVSAVHYMHANRVVHRDLKLENILLDDNGNVKLADFGLANVFSSDQLLSTFCGSPLYASPEIVNGLPYLGPEVDCWSLGVLLYTMVYGTMPFDGSDFRRLKNLITQGDYQQPQEPAEAAELIHLLLNPNPAKRATLENVCNHWWTNFGYDCTPIEENPSVSHVNLSHLQQSPSPSSASQSSSVSTSEAESETDLPLSLSSSISDNNPSIKSILKKTPKSVKKQASFDCEENFEKKDYSNICLVSHSCSSQQSHINLNKKPRKGILKNKHRHSDGYVSQTSELSFTHADHVYDSESPVSPNGKTGGCARQSSADSDSVSNNTQGEPYDFEDIEAVLNALEEDVAGHLTPPTKTSPSHHHHQRHQLHHNDHQDSGIVMETEQVFQELALLASGKYSDSHKSSSALQETVSSNGTFDKREMTTSTPCVPSQRKLSIKGILKKSSKFGSQPKGSRPDPSWRFSTGSHGSTSSGDVLDFSYDSADGEMFHTELSTVPIPMSDDRDVKTVQGVQYYRRLSCDDSVDECGPPPPLPKVPPPTAQPITSFDPDLDIIDSSLLPSVDKISHNDGDNLDVCEKIKLLDLDAEQRRETSHYNAQALFDLDEAREVYQRAFQICSDL